MSIVEFPTDVRKAAFWYEHKGFQVAALRPRSKDFKRRGKITRTPADQFEEDDNVGLLSRNGLTVVDLDAAESIVLADDFLPVSRHVYGRASKPRSKRLFKSKLRKRVHHKDLTNGETLSELRVNHMDVVPPSTHPGGEILAWDIFSGEVVEIDTEELVRATQLLDTAAMLLRRYPDAGNRHFWTLALAGFLRKLGLDENETLHVVKSAARFSNDEKLTDREEEVRSTWRKKEEEIIGAKQIVEDVEQGEQLVKTLRKIWQGSRTSTEFEYDTNGNLVKNSQTNIRVALTRLNVELGHDTFADTLTWRTDVWVNWQELRTRTLDRMWLEIDSRMRLRPEPKFFETVVKDLARRNDYHPVCEYLETLKWDETKRIDSWLIDYGRANDTEFNRVVGAIFLIAAVRRVREPGCKFDEMLVLESPQGWGKSTAITNLSPRENWVSEDLPLNSDSKRVIEKTRGIWLIEASELSGISSKYVENVKAFLSRRIDGPVRLAYGRLPESVARQFVIIGTTNSAEYWNDPTGGRRFWPVKVGRFDFAALARDRDQLWAEASWRENRGESIRLPKRLYPVAAEQQTLRMREDPWVDHIVDALSKPPPEWFARDKRARPTKNLVISRKTLFDVLGVQREFQGLKEGQRLSTIMKRLGFEKTRIRDPVTGEAGIFGWRRENFDEQEELKLEPKEET